MRKNNILNFIVVILLYVLIISCTDETTSPNEEDYFNYFPIGNNYVWTYEKVFNENVVNDSVLGNTYIDTVVFSLNIFDTLNNVVRYKFDRENYYNNTIYQDDNIIYSIEHPADEEGSFIYWKNNLKLNENWKNWCYEGTYSKPQINFEVNNEVANLDTIVSFGNFIEKRCVKINKLYTLLISSYDEKWYYSGNIGLVLIEGVTQNYDTTIDTYEYRLLDYNVNDDLSLPTTE